MVFRGISAAASLKLHPVKIIVSPSEVFRGISAAASLKLIKSLHRLFFWIEFSAAFLPRPHSFWKNPRIRRGGPPWPPVIGNHGGCTWWTSEVGNLPPVPAPRVFSSVYLRVSKSPRYWLPHMLQFVLQDKVWLGFLLGPISCKGRIGAGESASRGDDQTMAREFIPARLCGRPLSEATVGGFSGQARGVAPTFENIPGL